MQNIVTTFPTCLPSYCGDMSHSSNGFSGHNPSNLGFASCL